jgi:hypothetical protein
MNSILDNIWKRLDGNKTIIITLIIALWQKPDIIALFSDVWQTIIGTTLTVLFGAFAYDHIVVKNGLSAKVGVNSNLNIDDAPIDNAPGTTTITTAASTTPTIQ